MSAPGLRCWARRASDGALCDKPAGHHEQPAIAWCSSATAAGEWGAAACAPDAGPDGRGAAALRLLEVSHEIDREAFLAGTALEWSSRVRTIAARLRVSRAEDDLDVLERFGPGAPVRDLLALAADILRPWAGAAR